MMKLIIQIPCYNEADTLAVTLNDLPDRLEGIDVIETLIIDDGSTDSTVEVARTWGVDHIVSFKHNRGLAKGFMAGLDASVKLGADIIVNTDADNQYCAEDIQKIIQPILDGQADYVIGERPILETEHFSLKKKVLQRFGSWVVRIASDSDIADAPSGFRAMTREAALHMNCINSYTYTLETIIQAGCEGLSMTSVPIRTNGELRPSRLFRSIGTYVKRSISVIIRSFMMYKPLHFFCLIGGIVFLAGVLVGVRFLYFFFTDGGNGHVQSLILAAVLLMLGFQTVVVGLLSDIIAANRKLLEDVQYRIRKMEAGQNDSTHE